MAFLRTALALGDGAAVSRGAVAPDAPGRQAPAGFPAGGTATARPEATQRPAPASQPAGSTAGTQARQAEEAAPAAEKARAEPVQNAPSDAEMLAAVRDNWERILELTKQRTSPLLKAALQTVRQLEASGGTLVLQFEHETARGQIDRAENKQKVESLMEEVTGRPIHIRCTLAEAKSGRASRSAGRVGTEKGGGDDESFLREARSLGAVIKRLDQ